MKAQAYSLIAILLALPIFLFIIFFSAHAQQESFGSVDKVVSDQLHEVQRSIEEDFSRGIEISAKRALLACLDSVLSTGTGLDSSSARINELMTNGTLYSNSSFLMINNTLGQWQSRILAVPVIFNVRINNSKLAITPVDGFTYNFSVYLISNVSDNQRNISINRNVPAVASVSVEGYEDPVFSIKTNNLLRRTVREYPYQYFAIKLATGSAPSSCQGNVTFNNQSADSTKILVTANGSGISGYKAVVSQFGIPMTNCYFTGLANPVSIVNSSIQSGFAELYIDNQTGGLWHLPVLDMVRNGYYSDKSGPSYFTRLQLNLSSTSPGMESFVNIQDMQSSGVSISSGKSVIDYQYFSSSPVAGQKVRAFPDWFYIDSSRASDYNLTELLEP